MQKIICYYNAENQASLIKKFPASFDLLYYGKESNAKSGYEYTTTRNVKNSQVTEAMPQMLYEHSIMPDSKYPELVPSPKFASDIVIPYTISPEGQRYENIYPPILEDPSAASEYPLGFSLSPITFGTIEPALYPSALKLPPTPQVISPSKQNNTLLQTSTAKHIGYQQRFYTISPQSALLTERPQATLIRLPDNLDGYLESSLRSPDDGAEVNSKF